LFLFPLFSRDARFLAGTTREARNQVARLAPSFFAENSAADIGD
jgi:hypothetical protein